MKKTIYLDKPTQDTNALEIEVYYDKGGYNLFTYKEEARGYYLSVRPVLRADGCITYTSFSGRKLLLKEVKRKSANAEAEAEEIAKSKLSDLIKFVCNRNGIAVPTITEREEKNKMIIDAILDRKDAEDAQANYDYDPREFYHYVNYWAADGMEDAIRIAHAMDELEENDVRDALCLYIIHQDYNLQIIDYVNGKKWLIPERT